MSLKELRARGYCMTERQWLTVRPILFTWLPWENRKRRNSLFPSFYYYYSAHSLLGVGGWGTRHGRRCLSPFEKLEVDEERCGVDSHTPPR